MASGKRTTLARIRLILWGLVIVAGIGATAFYFNRIHTLQSVGGGAFAMTATDGRTFTQKDLVGRPSLLFFGYTYCPDVCPTTLADTSRWRRELGLGPDDLNIIFVSVDPERDDPESMKAYLSAFGTPIIGLSGTETQTQTIKDEFGVFSEKVDDPGASDYLINHTASVYLLNRNGQFVGTISYGEARNVALEKVRRLVSG